VRPVLVPRRALGGRADLDGHERLRQAAERLALLVLLAQVSVVAALVASLSNVTSIAGHVAMFIRVLNASQGD